MNANLRLAIGIRGTLVYRDADGNVLKEVPFYTPAPLPVVPKPAQPSEVSDEPSQ